MAEKKIQETPIPEGSNETDKKDVPKPAKVTSPVPIQVPRINMPSFTKSSPNELYRKMLPAVLFILTFVIVMSMLLIYMDTFALGAQQFRQNMTQDKELTSISADSPTLVAYVRQLHLAPRPSRTPLPAPEYTPRVAVLDRILGEIHNGTLVELMPAGPRDATARFLQQSRGWAGVCARAAPRDFLSLRSARALHACLSAGHHPRVVGYGSGAFRSRVMCLPLLTVLMAADALKAQYVVLAGKDVPSALDVLPFDRVDLKVIDFRSTDQAALNNTTQVLEAHNYTIAALFDDGIMYAQNFTKI